MMNHKPSETEIAHLWDYGVESYGYVKNKGNRTRKGVECATKFWNRSNKVQLRYYVGKRNEMQTVLNKGYGVTASLKLSR